MSADELSSPAWAIAQPGHPTILQSSCAPQPVNTFLHLNFIPRGYFTCWFLYEQCCHRNSAFIISLIPYGIGFFSLFNELNFHTLFSRYHLCHCLQSAELCLLPQSWDSHLLLPNSISTISHSFSCVRKPISATTQPPELPQFVISKMNRINCFTENKLCSWWNITSIWEGDMCVLQEYEILFGAPPDICRAKFPNFTANDTTIRVIFIAAVTAAMLAKVNWIYCL